MGALSDIFNTGEVHFKLVIEGMAFVWTTDDDLEGDDAGHGRTYKGGLNLNGMELSEHVDLRAGITEMEPITVQIVHEDADIEFAKKARVLCNLIESIDSTSSTSAVVTTNSLIATNDYVHINTECWRVTDRSTNTLTIERNRRDTQDQHHPVFSGSDGSWNVPVTDRPASIQGRRATIYVSSFDDEQILWRGRVSKAAYLGGEDSLAWCVDIDPIMSVLDQEIGESVPVKAHVRGIRYSTACQFGFRVKYLYDSVAVDESFAITGLFDDQDALIARIQSELDTIEPSTDGLTNWVASTSAAGRITIAFTSPADWAALGPVDGRILLEFGSPFDGRSTHSPSFPNTHLDPSVTYSISLDASAHGGNKLGSIIDGPQSRACIGDPGVKPFVDGLFFEDIDEGSVAPEHLPWVVALDRDLGVLAGNVISIENAIAPGGARIAATFTIKSIEAGNVYVLERLVSTGRRSRPLWGRRGGLPISNGNTTVYLDAESTITARLSYGIGTYITGFLASVVAQSVYANTGVTPFLTAGDVSAEASSDSISASVFASFRALRFRDYVFDEGVSLLDVITPEMMALGHVMRITADGKIGFAPIERPSSLQRISATIDGDSIVTPYDGQGSWPEWVPSPDGVVSVCKIIDGDNVFIIRDEASIGIHKNRGSGTTEIEPVSTGQYPLTIGEADAIGRRFLGYHASEYAQITMDVTYDKIDVLVGDYVALTSPHVIDVDTGTRGVTDLICQVIGRRWPMDPPEGSHGWLMLRATVANVGGYAPSLRVTAGADLGSDLWELTVAAAEFVDPVSGENDSDHFHVDDFVRVYEFDEFTPVNESGVVTAIVNATTVRVQFAAAPPWGAVFSGDYIVEYDVATVGVNADQEPYVYFADADGNLADDTRGRVLE